MNVYVVKRIDGKYLSGYNNYDYRLENPCKPCWTEKLYNAKIFEEYEEADNFCNTIDCQIVECSFMETTELSDYTKQVRKEACEEIRKLATEWNNDQLYIKITEILDQIQGEINEK